MKLRVMLAAIVTCVMVDASAQVQRLAIAFGGVSIGPRSTGFATSYCVDRSRHAPSAESTLNHVLLGGDSTRIVTPTRSFTLEEGVEKGYIVLHGTNNSVGRLLDDPLLAERIAHGSAAERAKFERLRRLWSILPPADRTRIDAEISRQHGGDYRRVTIENKLSEPIRFEASEPALVGPVREAAIEIPKGIGASGAPQQQAKLNRIVWEERTKHQQAMLHDVGAFKGRSDGKYGPRTHAAVERFQRENHLLVSGILDERTERVLTDQSQAAKLNADNLHVKTMSIAWRPETGYSLTTAKGLRTFKDANKMADVVFSSLNDNDIDAVYLDVEGVDARDADALAATLRAHAAPESALRIEPLMRSREGSMIRDLLLTPGVELVKIERTVEKPLEAKAHFRRTWLGKARDIFVRLVAKTSEVLQTASDALQDIFRSSPKLSIAEALSETKARLRKQYPNMDAEGFQAFVRDQARTVQVVELLRSAAWCS